MKLLTTAPELDPGFVHAFRAGTLTRQQARAFAAQDPAVIEFQMLALTGLVAAKTMPHTPSGSLVPFEKTQPKGKRRTKPGGQHGHDGHARRKPERIDRHVEHKLSQCPNCGGEPDRTDRTRTRIIEDVPADRNAEVAEHTIHRDGCPQGVFKGRVLSGHRPADPGAIRARFAAVVDHWNADSTPFAWGGKRSARRTWERDR